MTDTSEAKLPPMLQPMQPPPELGDLSLGLLKPLAVRTEPLCLYARAAPGNHPCIRLGGFDSPEQMSMSGPLKPRLKGAIGWVNPDEMLRGEIEQARGHGVSGVGILEGIEDIVWRLTSTEPAPVAEMDGHRITRVLDLTGAAIEAATPGSPQAIVIEALRVYKWGMLAGVELPRPPPITLPNGMTISHRERNVVVFPDRVELKAEELGPFNEVIPLRST
jgi:hypothetical protein